MITENEVKKYVQFYSTLLGKKMFEDSSFDAVLFVTALEFIPDIEQATKETHRILQSNGVLLILILNPYSQYFKQKHGNPSSHIRKHIQHTDINNIHDTISRFFIIKNKGYLLGITKQDIIDTTDQDSTSLFVVKGEKLWQMM